ncbi:MAG: hypothetical protein LBV71_01305 [Prevotella sp.]|jgi:hypothetical protein|nr:hypothetical protein [Prevotella sp.]
MKKMNLLFSWILLSCCMFAQTERNIIGTWKFLKIDAIVETNSREATDKIVEDIRSQLESDSIYIEFTTNGEWITIGEGVQGIGTYSVNQNRLTDLETNISMDYRVNKDTLILDVDFNKLDTYDTHKLTNMDITPESIIIDKILAETYFLRVDQSSNRMSELPDNLTGVYTPSGEDSQTCQIELISKNSNNIYQYVLKEDTKQTQGTISFYGDYDIDRELTIELEGYKWESVGDISDENEAWPVSETRIGLEGTLKDGEITFMNYRNTMDYYIKFSCPQKFVILEKK